MRSLRWGHVERVRRLLKRLGSIPYDRNLMPVYGGVWQRDYEAVVKGKVRETFTTPYMPAAQICMGASLRFMPRSEEISFVFDRQKQYEGSVQQLDSIVFKIADVDRRAKGVTFLPRDGRRPLSRDFLAFQLREYHTNRACCEGGRPRVN